MFERYNSPIATCTVDKVRLWGIASMLGSLPAVNEMVFYEVTRI
jgi:hypothetical protein